MGRTEFDTSTNITTVGIMHRLTRELWSTGKSVIIYSGLYVLKGLFEMRKRVFYGSALIKIASIGLRIIETF